MTRARDTASIFAADGSLNISTSVNLGDNEKAYFGTSNDLQIYHDGTHSYIYENGTGSLRIRATEFDVQQLSNGNSLFKSDGSSAQLLENGTLRLETTSSGVTVTGVNINVTSSDIYQTAVNIDNTDTGGRHWGLHSTGSTNTAGRFRIYDYDANVERMTIDSSGKVGINQTSMAGNFALHVTGLGGGSNDARTLILKGAGNHTTIGSTGPTLVLQNTDSTTNNIVKLSFESASAGETVSINAINTNHSSHYGDMAFNTRGSGGYSEKMRIMANGNVGIGTTSPDSILHVKGADVVEGDAKGQIVIRDTAAYNANPIMGIIFQGEHTTGSQAYMASIFGAKENTTDGNYSGYLSFGTRSQGSTTAERMRITSGGNVGIGTTGPINKLHIRNTTHSSTITGNATAGSIKFHSQSGSYTNGDYYGGIVWARPNSNGGTPTTFIASKITNSGSAADLVFGADTATTVTERMRIDNSGRVTMPYQPCCFAYKSGGGNSTSASGSGVLDTAGTNVGNHFSTSTGRFTCPVAGNYLVTWHAMNSQSNTGTVTAVFRVNGVGYSYFHIENSHPQSCSQQVVYSASAGDYFDLSISHFHFNGGSTFKYPGMSVVLIG